MEPLHFMIINGNVGNKENSSNWAGDLDVEYKVDKNGKFRISLFTRSSDSYSNYLDDTQRSGIGLTFQDEFDTFGEMWRNLFYSRKRKEEYQINKIREAEKAVKAEAEAANIVKKKIQKGKVEEEYSYDLINFNK